MFHSVSLEGYTSSINKAVDVLSDNLHSSAERGEVVDMWRQLGKMTMQVRQPCRYVLGSRRELRSAARSWSCALLWHPAGMLEDTLKDLKLAPLLSSPCLLLSDESFLTTCLYLQVIGASAFG